MNIYASFIHVYMHQNFLSRLSPPSTSSCASFTTQVLSFICKAVTWASSLLLKVKRKEEVWIIGLYRKKNKLVFKYFSVCVEFVCLCVCEHMRTYLCTHVETEEGIRLPLVLSALFLKKISLTEPRARHFSARLAARKTHGPSCLHLPQRCDYGCTCPCLAFLWLAAGYLNTGLHACIATVLCSWTIFPSLVLFLLAY